MPDGSGLAAPNLPLISACVCASVLALSSVGHLRTGTLRYALAAHGIVPQRLLRFVSASVPIAEGFLALLVAGSLLANVSWALWLSAGLFAGYAGYSLAVRYRAPDVRTGCGCGVGEHPLGVSTAARAAGLAILAAAGALGGGPPRADGLLISLLMSVSVVCLVVWLPVSLSQPTVEQSR